MTNPEKNKPSTDPLIDEVRAAREELSREFGHDPRRLAEELRRVQKELETGGARIVPVPDRPGAHGSRAG